MAIHVVNEARRCLHCKKPMCREGCPINTTSRRSSSCSVPGTKRMLVRCFTRTIL